MDVEPKLSIPLDWVIVDAIGALLTAAGVYGLLAGPGAAIPVLGDPGVAWLCILVGVALMGLAVVRIFARIKAQLDAMTRRG